jgi:hypothetical protein
VSKNYAEISKLSSALEGLPTQLERLEKKIEYMENQLAAQDKHIQTMLHDLKKLHSVLEAPNTARSFPLQPCGKPSRRLPLPQVQPRPRPSNNPVVSDNLVAPDNSMASDNLVHSNNPMQVQPQQHQQLQTQESDQHHDRVQGSWPLTPAYCPLMPMLGDTVTAPVEPSANHAPQIFKNPSSHIQCPSSVLPNSQSATITYTTLPSSPLPQSPSPLLPSGSQTSEPSPTGSLRPNQLMQDKGKSNKVESGKKAMSSATVSRSRRRKKTRDNWFEVSYRHQSSLGVYEEYDRYITEQSKLSKLPRDQQTLLLRKTGKQLSMRWVIVSEILHLKKQFLSKAGQVENPTLPFDEVALAEACQELDSQVKGQQNPKTGLPWNRFTTNRAITFCKQQQAERGHPYPSGSNRVATESKSDSKEIGHSESGPGNESSTGGDSGDEEEEEEEEE